MMKFNKINFGLLSLLFFCSIENILGTSDKNIEEGLKRKYKIVDLDGNILKNEQGEDFSFIVTCKYNGRFYKWYKEIESDIKEIEEEKDGYNRIDKNNKLENKSVVSSWGDMVKTNDGKFLVVKDSKIENKVYLVLGKYDKNSKTANIFLDKNYKLQTSSPYDIKENNTIHVMKYTDEDCGGTLILKEVNEYKCPLYKIQIVYCELKDIKPQVSLEELGKTFVLKKKSKEKKETFVKDSDCCDRLGNYCEDFCP